MRELFLAAGLGLLGYGIYKAVNQTPSISIDPAYAEAYAIAMSHGAGGDALFDSGNIAPLTSFDPSVSLSLTDLGVTTPILNTGSATPSMTELETFTRTLYGEARGESDAGIQGVANVILNRVHDPKNRFPKTVSGVCLQPNQFSVWNTYGKANELANHRATLAATDTDSRYRVCQTIAATGLAGNLVDNTGGAEWYHDTSITKPPSWSALVKTVQIGRLIFYKG